MMRSVGRNPRFRCTQLFNTIENLNEKNIFGFGSNVNANTLLILGLYLVIQLRILLLFFHHYDCLSHLGVKQFQF